MKVRMKASPLPLIKHKETMLWYLSFADPMLPRGTQFLGATVIEGWDIVSAASNAYLLGINPGGEVMGIPIPLDPQDDKVSFISKETLEKYAGPLVNFKEACNGQN